MLLSIAFVHVEASATVQVEVEAAPAPAAVETWTDTAYDVDALVAPHWEASVGFALATEGFADPSITASIGRQVGPVRLGLDYMRYERDLGMALVCPVPASRIGLTARYRVSMPIGLGGMGVYTEAGIGRETRTFKDDTRESAATGMLGFGMEVLVGGAKSAGFDIGMRFVVDEEDRVAGLVQVGLLLASR